MGPPTSSIPTSRALLLPEASAGSGFTTLAAAYVKGPVATLTGAATASGAQVSAPPATPESPPATLLSPRPAMPSSVVLR